MLQKIREILNPKAELDKLKPIDQPEKLTQSYFDEAVAKLLTLQGIYGVGESRQAVELDADQQVMSIVGEQSLDMTSEEEFMNASVPKPTISLALARLLEQQGGLDKPVTIDIGTIAELVGREPSRFFSNPLYSSLLNDENLVFLVKSAVEAHKAGKIDELDRLKRQFGEVYAELKLEIPLQELMYHALAISSNNATRIAKDLIIASGGDLNAEIQKLTPNYTPSPASMANMEHWVEPRPNVGVISEHLTLLHDLGMKMKSGNLSAAEEMVVKDITNNPTNFFHCFTHSELGKELIAKGYKIIEKTGYYPCVFWVRDQFNPPHNKPPYLVIATMVSIVPPEGSDDDVVSLAHYQRYAVPLPKTLSERDIAGEHLVFPDDTSVYTKTVSDPIKARVDTPFRNSMRDKYLSLAHNARR